jgi:hypothetical protein
MGVADNLRRMECPVALRYPNGRAHETTITFPDELAPGDEFDAFGRRWRAAKPYRSSRGGAEQMLCVCVGAPADAQEMARS